MRSTSILLAGAALLAGIGLALLVREPREIPARLPAQTPPPVPTVAERAPAPALSSPVDANDARVAWTEPAAAARHAEAAPPVAAAEGHSFTNEQRVHDLQRMKKEFEESLAAPGATRFWSAYQLDLFSIAVLLDAQRRGQSTRGLDKVQLVSKRAGEHRFSYDHYLYAFEYAEFPEHAELQESCNRALTTQSSASLEFPTAVQTAVMDRVNTALEILTHGG